MSTKTKELKSTKNEINNLEPKKNNKPRRYRRKNKTVGNVLKDKRVEHKAFKGVNPTKKCVEIEEVQCVEIEEVQCVDIPKESTTIDMDKIHHKPAPMAFEKTMIFHNDPIIKNGNYNVSYTTDGEPVLRKIVDNKRGETAAWLMGLGILVLVIYFYFSN